MKILKGYVFRMYPTEKQEKLINKTIGCSRFIYNYFLDDKIKEYKIAGKSKSAYEQIKLIPLFSKKNMAKGLNENPISEIVRVLKYKADWNNKRLIQIDRYYPSSQICGICDYQNKEVKDLSIRKWECPVCHTKHTRDYNAAVNIMLKGLEKYMKEFEQFI